MKRQGIVEEISPDLFRIVLASSLYEKEAIFAVAGRYRDRFYIKLEPGSEGEIAVLFQRKDGQERDFVENAALTFVNDILDQQLRLDLERRTGGLREIIYRRAFLPLDKSEENHEESR